MLLGYKAQERTLAISYPVAKAQGKREEDKDLVLRGSRRRR